MAEKDGRPLESSAGDESEDVEPTEGEGESSTPGEQSSLFDVVSGATGGESDEEDGDDDSASPAGSDGEEPGEDESGQPGESGGEGDEGEGAEGLEGLLEQLASKDVPLHKIERFREVLQENRQLKRDLEQATPTLERMRAVSRAARVLGLTNEQVENYLSALETDDPAAAVGKIRSILDPLEASVGEKLPDDLQQRVDDGYLDKEYAQEIAALRAKAARQERATELTQQEHEEDQFRRFQKKVTTAVNDYQRQLQQSDPDWSPAKHKLVVGELRDLIAREGPPDSVDRALKMAEKAYDSANKLIQGFRPESPSVPRTPTGRRPAPGSQQPKSMQEVVERAAAGVDD